MGLECPKHKFSNFPSLIVCNAFEQGGVDCQLTRIKHLPPMGKTVFKEASKTKTVSQDGFTLEPNNKMSIGHVNVGVKDVRVQSSGDPHVKSLQTRQLYVDLVAEGQDPDSIESIRLVDATGKTLSQTRGVGRRVHNGKVTGTFTLYFADRIIQGKLEITYWADASRVEIPVLLTVTAGL